MRRRRRFADRDFDFDPTDLIDSLHDVIEAALDAGLDSVYAVGDLAASGRSWKADDLCNEMKAFAGRFAAHPSWRSARSRATGWRSTTAGESTSRAWSDAD
jgi:hypothetical protein